MAKDQEGDQESAGRTILISNLYNVYSMSIDTSTSDNITALCCKGHLQHWRSCHQRYSFIHPYMISRPGCGVSQNDMTYVLYIYYIYIYVYKFNIYKYGMVIAQP